MVGSHDIQKFLGLEALIVSQPMKDLLALAQRAAATNAAVLIYGESGSGKELVARAIHHYSARVNCPWVDINCGALPEHLIESELFGHEKGAFSGADAARPGLFELADRGTLFLDEIGELDPRMQVKLLRVLDGSPYFRLGGSRKIAVDVRVVAATNQDLPAMIRSGRFRADLYHRLGQIKLSVPPLRERREDILPLARLFLEQVSPGVSLETSAEKQILAHAWSGNVRELRNTIIASSLLAMGERIGASDLVIEPEPESPLEQPIDNLEELERRTIERVLARTGQHQEKAASLLGISSRTLSRKLKSYELPASPGENHAIAKP